MLVMSAGLGLTFVPMTLIATTNVTDDDAGLASGLFNSSQQIGGALGLAILSTVAAASTHERSLRPARGPTPAEQASAPGGRLPGGVRRRRRADARRASLIAALLIRRKDVAAILAEPDAGPGERCLRPAPLRRAPQPGEDPGGRVGAVRRAGADLCVDEIARRAGVGHATVFRRFPTKDDLILAMIEQRLADARRGRRGGGRRSEDAWEGLVAAMAAHRRAPGRGPRPDPRRSAPSVIAPDLREARERAPRADRRPAAPGAGGGPGARRPRRPRTCSS